MNIPPDLDFAEYIAFIGQQESQEVHAADHWREAIKARASGALSQSGDPLPWSKTHDKFRLRPGELTVWGGYDGHMKSLVLGQIMAHLAYQGVRSAIASLEMKPEATLLRMARQITGCHPSNSAIDRFVDYAKDYILVYDQLDMIPEEKILGFMHYCGSVLGCGHIVLDSLTKMAFDEKDKTGEIRFVNRLQYFAKALGVHIHLICHCRKPEGGDESKPPSKNSIRGPSQITNLADNVAMVWSNKAKFEAIKKMDAGFSLSDREQELLEQPCQKLLVKKQREGDFEGAFTLWLHQASLQFLGNERHLPTRYFEGAAA